MTTNQLGPLVAGRDDAKVSDQSGPARKRAELREAFVLNLGYFWVGRFGGALAYFFPAVVAALLFLLRAARSRRLAGARRGRALVDRLHLDHPGQLVRRRRHGGEPLLPEPAAGLPVPGARRALAVAWRPAARPAAAVFLAPILLAPVDHSLRPGAHATRGAFRLLPAELTMLNDLSVFTETWRKKRPFGFVGNAERPADPDAFFLYFMDDGTYGKEEWAGRTGFWLRGGGPAEVMVRAFDLALVERIVLRLTGGPLGDTVDVRLGWHRARVRLGPGERREVELRAGRGVPYYDTYLHVLELRSHRGAPLADGRRVGAFVEPRLVMGPLRARGTVTARPARIALGVVSGLVLLAALAVDLPSASDGRFWSDGATYYAMAASLAFDGDLEFRAEDLARVRQAYPGGPQGVFLKRVASADGGTRLVYAKPLVYPAVAAPLVRVLGADRGLLLLNAIVLVAALWLGFGLLREGSSEAGAAAGTVAVFLGGVAPLTCCGRRRRSSTSAW